MMLKHSFLMTIAFIILIATAKASVMELTDSEFTIINSSTSSPSTDVLDPSGAPIQVTRFYLVDAEYKVADIAPALPSPDILDSSNAPVQVTRFYLVDAEYKVADIAPALPSPDVLDSSNAPVQVTRFYLVDAEYKVADIAPAMPSPDILDSSGAPVQVTRFYLVDAEFNVADISPSLPSPDVLDSSNAPVQVTRFYLVDAEYKVADIAPALPSPDILDPNIVPGSDIIPPASITNLSNISYSSNYINWTWNDPMDYDFANVSVWIDSIFITNVPKGMQFYNATGFAPDSEHTIATRTIDINGTINQTWISHTARTAPAELPGDTTPPASITNLTNVSYSQAHINWTWNDPMDYDFVNVSVWIDSIFMTNVPKGIQFYNATGFVPDSEHTIATRTIDINGTINQTWVNHTARTAMTTDTTTPGSITNLTNASYAVNYINWTWTDPSDPDLSRVMIFINGVFENNVPKGVQHYNATGMDADTMYDISTHTVDISGNINLTWVNHTARTAMIPDTTTSSPAIIGFFPASPVNDLVGATRAFNITLNQTVNLTWYINGTQVQYNESVNEALYTNISAAPGTWNVTATAENENGTAVHSWIWNVKTNVPPSIVLESPPNNSVIKNTSRLIDLSVIDDNLDYAWFIHDGISRILESPYDINVSGWTDGAQSIEVHARDLKGLESVQIYNFIVDISPPNITNFYSFPKVPYDNDEISFTAQIYDESPITVQLEYSLDYGKTYQSTAMNPKTSSIYDAKIGPFAIQSDLIMARVLASDGENTQTREIYVPIKSDKPSLKFNYRSPLIDGSLDLNDGWQIENVGLNGFIFNNDVTDVTNERMNLSYSRNTSYLFSAFEINGSQDAIIKLSGYFDSSPDKKLTRYHTDGFEISFNKESIISSRDLVYDDGTSRWVEDNSLGGSNDVEVNSSYQDGKYTLEIAKIFNSSDDMDNNANNSRSLIVVDIFSNNEHQYLIWPGMIRSGLIPDNQSGIESFAGNSDPFASRNWADIDFSNKLNIKTYEPYNYQMFSRGENISYSMAVLDSKQKFVYTDAVYATLKNNSDSITKLNLNGNTYENNYTIPSYAPIGIKELIINATDTFGNYGESHLFVYTLDAYIASISLNRTFIISGESILGDIYVSRPNNPYKFLNDSQVNVTIKIIDENNITVSPEKIIPSSIVSNKPLFSEIINTTGLSNGVYTAKINITDSIGNLIEYQNKFTIVENYSISVSTDQNIYERNHVVNISGIIQYANGTEVPNATVKIDIIGKRGTRTFTTISNIEGSYQYEFTPFETEAGNYDLIASTEVNGLPGRSSTNFTIYGLIFSSRQTNVQIFKGTSTTFQLNIINVGENVLHDVSININDTNLTDGVSANLIGWSISDLKGGETKIVDVQIDSSLDSPPNASFEFTVNSFEGSSDKTQVKVTLQDGNPYMTIDPDLIKLNTNPGSSIIKTMTLKNTGYGILKDARIIPPANDWIKINRNLTIGDILPEETISFEILIYPSADTGIGRYIDNFTVSSSNYPELKVWIDVSLISSKNGSLTVHTIDEYLGTNISSPKITLMSQEVQGLNFEKTGDAQGNAEFRDVPTGRYTYVIGADKYEAKKGTIDIGPVLENESSPEVDILLHPSWLDVAFSVTPTTIVDKYDVTLEMTLDAQLPVPVLQAIPDQMSYTLTPGSGITNQSFDLYNLGLISTKNIKISTNTNSGVKINLLSDSLSELKAKDKTQILFDISLDPTTPHGIQITNYITISGEFLYSKDGVEKMVPLNEISIPVYVTVPVGDIEIVPNQITTVLEPGGVYSSTFTIKNIDAHQINNIVLKENPGDSNISISLPVSEIPVLLPGESKVIDYSVSVSPNSNWNKIIYNYIDIHGEDFIFNKINTNFGIIVEIPDRIAQLSGSRLAYTIEPGDHIITNVIIKNIAYINSGGYFTNVTVNDINISYSSDSENVTVDEINVENINGLLIDSLIPGESRNINLQISSKKNSLRGKTAHIKINYIGNYKDNNNQIKDITGQSTIDINIRNKGLIVNPSELWISPALEDTMKSGKISGLRNITGIAQYKLTVANPHIDSVQLSDPENPPSPCKVPINIHPFWGLITNYCPGENEAQIILDKFIGERILFIYNLANGQFTLPWDFGVSMVGLTGEFDSQYLEKDQKTSVLIDALYFFANLGPTLSSGNLYFDYQWENDDYKSQFDVPVHVIDIGLVVRGLEEIISYGGDYFVGDQNVNMPAQSTPTTQNVYSVDSGPKVTEFTEARVKIQLSQELTLEREAFTAKTDLTNKLNSDLEDISISFNIKDENGVSSNDKFFIQQPDLTNINSINGDGIINSSSTSTISWLMIPTNDSGGISESGKNYDVQLNISGTVNGVPFIANSDKVRITVKPQPKLSLTYYLPKRIVAAQPFHMAVKVKNTGYGYARNLKIQSAQPRIIENNSSLLLNFSISSDLKVDFGNISPGEERIKYWTLESSVPGKFSDFTANFTHSEILGGEKTSLITGIDTELLNRGIYANGMDIPYIVDSNKDGKPDSILDLATNQESNLSESTGSIITDPANLTVKVQVSKPKDQWVIIEIPDIFNGDRAISRIYRSDGVVVNPMNYWIEDNKIIIIDDPDTEYIIKYGSSTTAPLDTTPPVTFAALSGSIGNNGWYISDVEVNLTATDNEGGSGINKTEYSFDGTNWSTYTVPLTITDEGTTTIYYFSADNSGNVESAKNRTFSIDKTPPQVTINTPANGGVYILNQTLIADWSAYDSLSGIASVTGAVPNGSAIDTSIVGAKTFSVAATDNAGNSATQTAYYTIVYDFLGILPPIRSNGSSIFKLGRTVPVKFRITDANGNNVSTAVANLTYQKITDEILGTIEEPISTSEANDGNTFRYDITDELYIFNMGTSGLTTGTYLLSINLDDGTVKTVRISIKQ